MNPVMSTRATSSRALARIACGLVLAIGAVAVAQAGVRYSTRFESAPTWSGQFTEVNNGNGRTYNGSTLATFSQSAPGLSGFGTIDTPDTNVTTSDARSGAFRLTVLPAAAVGTWTAAGVSPTIPMPASSYADEYLTVAVDLRPSSLAPIKILLYIGSTRLSKTVYPPVAGSYFRHSIDLRDMDVEIGPTNVDRGSGQVKIGFQIGSAATGVGWANSTTHTLDVDNLSFTEPTYFVNPTFLGTSNGSQSAPYKTVQAAVDAADAGDVICLLNGFYRLGLTDSAIATIAKAGEPDKWIVLRSAPGNPAVIWEVPAGEVEAYNALEIIRTPTVTSAYIEVRDMIFRGTRPTGSASVPGSAFYNELLNAVQNVIGNQSIKPKYNTNGISVSGRTALPGTATFEQKLAAELLGVHHVRVINNVVYNFPGGGISGLHADHLTFVGNESYGNCYYTRYGPSGFSILHAWNFDNSADHKCFIVGNRAYGNQCYVPYKNSYPARTTLSDGNGIIVDVNIEGQYVKDADIPSGPSYGYRGKTLISNNLSYANGGSGLACTGSQNIDVVNNTFYRNVHSEPQQGDFDGTVPYGTVYNRPFVFFDIQFGLGSKNINFRNNIIWSDRSAWISSNAGTNVVYSDNLYHGKTGSYPNPKPGLNSTEDWLAIGSDTGTVIFTAPSLSGTANFIPQASSPALATAVRSAYAGVPIIDISYYDPQTTFPKRPVSNLDRGAHER